MNDQGKATTEVRVFLRFAPTIGLLMALAPAMAHAQTNIDQGKTPAQIFANDCATCHKAARGLANGKNSLMLAGFLREHYTSSREQAAALAAYVLGAGGGESGAAQGRGKPGPERARTPGEEGKPTIRQARQPVKPEEEAPTAGKPQRPTDEGIKPDEDTISVEEPASPSPGRRPAAGRNEVRPTATRGRRKEPEAPPSEPATVVAAPAATVVAAPASTETPSRDMGSTPTAAAPTETQPDQTSTIPRDNIPD